jgi:hypothetical protein
MSAQLRLTSFKTGAVRTIDQGWIAADDLTSGAFAVSGGGSIGSGLFDSFDPSSGCYPNPCSSYLRLVFLR